ncbi:Cuticle protein [Nesidiocoris tenuis]|uniref:Cuticle protein n=1 Tax=Nesidiocoris tenuis TaxID=355587 RepID=A0ABN7BBD7_9HEMI|nr:Cuticle protein [Nesidiocoris tenuis]
MKSYFAFAALAVLMAFAAAHPIEHHEEEHHEEHHYPPQPYKFRYDVEDHHTGDLKSHLEHGDGHGVQGVYKLKEADGTIREVHYTADKHSGYNAVVKHIGTPKHDDHYKQWEYEYVKEVHEPAKHYPTHEVKVHV